MMAYESDIDKLHVDGPNLYWLRRRDLGESAITNDRLERRWVCSLPSVTPPP
ncbi:MAG: hypothetical protein R3C44_17570 [Chloroflexota bacterium]